MKRIFWISRTGPGLCFRWRSWGHFSLTMPFSFDVHDREISDLCGLRRRECPYRISNPRSYVIGRSADEGVFACEQGPSWPLYGDDTVVDKAGYEGGTVRREVVFCLSHFVHYDVAIQWEVRTRSHRQRERSCSWKTFCKLTTESTPMGMHIQKTRWKRLFVPGAFLTNILQSLRTHWRRTQLYLLWRGKMLISSYVLLKEYLKKLTLSCRRCTNSTLLACKQIKCYLKMLEIWRRRWLLS